MADIPTLPPLPMRAGHLPLADVINLYMAYYAGRDTTRVQRLTWWKARLGTVPLQDLSDDHVHEAMEALANQHGRYFAGKDADDRPILRAKAKPLAAATLNRYQAALAAVITFAMKRRIAPKGYVHPVRLVELRAEDNIKTRFLSDDECRRLLDACRRSTWPRLYALVLAALTTGARKGELLGLTWASVDLERAEARITRTKNSDSRVLPLVPAVVEELAKFKAGASSLVFRSPRDPARAFSFESRFHEALRQAGIRGVTFHTLRHSAASALARNGATLLEVAEVLGHRQLQTSKRYAHLATSHKAALVNRILGDMR